MLVCMVNPKLLEMQKTVREELEHINRGDIYQSMLRNLYWNLRINSLSKKPKYPDDKTGILKLSIQKVKEWAKKDGIEFNPKFDVSFFEGRKWMRKQREK